MNARETEQAKAAVAAVGLALRGDFDGVLGMFAPAQQRRLTAAAIASAWQTHVTRHGAVWSFEATAVHTDSSVTAVTDGLPSGCFQATLPSSRSAQ